MKTFFKKHWLLILVVIYFIFMAAIYGVMSVVKHSHYETFSDLGINNQGIWQFSQFRWPISSYHVGLPFLADHFSPILAVLAPLYWFFPGERTLLFVQPFIILSAIIPFFLISYKMTKSKLFSLAVIFAYSFYIPLQNVIFYDFHKVIFIPLLLAWAYYFLITKRLRLLILSLFLLLITKEEVGFLVAAFGTYIFIFHREYSRWGLLWAAIGFLFPFAVIKIIIPAMGGTYLYSGPFTDLLKNPLSAPFLFFNSPVKWETIKDTFRPYAYLPLFSPIGLMLSLEDLFIRFADQQNVIRWTIAYHYSAAISAIVVLGTIWSADFYTRFLPKHRKYLLVLLAVFLMVITRVEQINRSAVLLIKRPIFWARAPWMDSLDKAIAIVPKEASVATQNNLSSHLSTRNNIYELPNIDKAEFVLVDFHEGASGYNFWGEKDYYRKEIFDGIKANKYQILFSENEVYLLKKVI